MKNLFKFIAIAVFFALFFAVAGFVFMYAVKIPVLSYCLYALAGTSVLVALIMVIIGYASFKKR